MNSYAVMHVHGVWELFLAEAAAEARLSGIPVFVSAHGMLDQWSMRQSKLKKQFALQLQTGAMLRHADAIVYGTEDELEECRHVVPSSSGAVVPNGIDTGELSPNSLPHLPDLKVLFPQIREWKRTILFFSRVHPKKGLDLLLDAFMATAPMFPGVGLLIAGIAQDRAFETELRKRIADSPMTDRIAFTTELFGPAARIVFRNLGSNGTRKARLDY
jgi:glycosyltransferase involved in cell wall biosynthesis